MATPDSPFIQALVALSTARIKYVVVGVGGINFYARDPQTAFMTQDLDVWIRPRVSSLREALKTLSMAEFRFEAGGEPFVNLADDMILENVIRMTSNLVARGPLDTRMDLMLAMAGYAFEPVYAGAVIFSVAGVSIRVAPLETILGAKQAAGREKDLRFLEAFRARRDEFLPRSQAKPKGPRNGKKSK